MGQTAEERMTTEIAGTRENLSRDVDALYDKVSPSRVVERRKAAVRGRLSGVRDKVMGTTQGATGSVGGTAQQAVTTVQRQTQGSPLAAGLVAFGAGMVASALIPASEKEARATQRLTEAAKGSGIVEEAKSVGQEVGQNLKDKAAEAAQEVKASAQDSAQTVREEGQSAAQTVKEEAQPGSSTDPVGGTGHGPTGTRSSTY